MKRSVVNRYYREIVEALNECEIRWSPCPRIGSQVVVGRYLDGVITVWNNPQENWVLTFIHEALHHLHPDVPEYDSRGEMIDLLSERLFCAFSTRQLDTLRAYIPLELLKGKPHSRSRSKAVVKKRR